MMHMNDFARTCAVLMTILLLTACDRSKQPEIDPREAFVGNYSYTSTGSVDLYLGEQKMDSYPINEQGEMSITLAQKPDEVMVIVEKDTSLAHVADNYLLLEPSTEVEKYGEVEMTFSFTYGKATINNRVLTFPTNISISAVYQDKTVSGSGQMEIVAVKK